jgi:hypothetical protein
MESVDVAFRLGYEQGAQSAQMQQMQQQQQQIAAKQAQMDTNGINDNQVQDGSNGAQIQDDSRGVGQQTGAAGAPQGMSGSELDNHINELEGLMQKSEYGTDQWETLKKSVDNLKAIKVKMDLSLNQDLIKSIGRNLNKPLVITGRAKHNMSDNSKNALTLQHKIVGEIMDTWTKEEAGLPTDIIKILQTEGLSKKE